MGAFHNQIRENETFESLMDLYSEALATNREQAKGIQILEAGSVTLSNVITQLRADLAANESGVAVLAQFVHEFESDFVISNEHTAMIVDGPGERWGPIVPLYGAALNALARVEKARGTHGLWIGPACEIEGGL